ncbi:hypothetical protein FRB90_002425 [Tulasnella sp. 427]|nr:hypothetical protein FRB90_002425 [Tulasnella sp. 427]
MSVNTLSEPHPSRQAIINETVTRTIRTTVKLHPENPLCPEPWPSIIKKCLCYRGKGTIEVYRYEKGEVLAYYVTVPSTRARDRLLNTRLNICGWKWTSSRLDASDRRLLSNQLVGLAEGHNSLFALPEPVEKVNESKVVINPTPLLPWEPLCLFPILDISSPSWELEGSKKANKSKRRGRPLREIEKSVLPEDDSIGEGGYSLTSRISSREPIQTAGLVPPNDDDLKCERYFESERARVLGGKILPEYDWNLNSDDETKLDPDKFIPMVPVSPLRDVRTCEEYFGREKARRSNLSDISEPYWNPILREETIIGERIPPTILDLPDINDRKYEEYFELEEVGTLDIQDLIELHWTHDLDEEAEVADYDLSDWFDWEKYLRQESTCPIG